MQTLGWGPLVWYVNSYQKMMDQNKAHQIRDKRSSLVWSIKKQIISYLIWKVIWKIIWKVIWKVIWKIIWNSFVVSIDTSNNKKMIWNDLLCDGSNIILMIKIIIKLIHQTHYDFLLGGGIRRYTIMLWYSMASGIE